jgi:hypothetical protein
MAPVNSFRTRKFDVTAETPNPVNPIAGQSVLSWLRAELAKAKANYTATEPDTEDWGWYIGVTGNDASTYLVGASADVDGSTPDVEWVIQVHVDPQISDVSVERET